MNDSTVTALTCPKCESPMRSYERNGIVVDQCTGCRGLDERAGPSRPGRRRGGFLGDLLDFGD